MCDVTGYGIGASALTSRVNSEVRHFILDRLAPREIVRSLNAFIREHFGKTHLFLTFIAARIELNGQILTYAGASHPGLLLIRQAIGEVQTLASQSPLIEAFENVLSEEPDQSLPLERGDRLLFYTDGVMETVSASGRQLGIDGLAGIVPDAMKLDLFKMADYVFEEVDRYRQGPVVDGQTLIVVEIR